MKLYRLRRYRIELSSEVRDIETPLQPISVYFFISCYEFFIRWLAISLPSGVR